jgi:hypothetical protein
VNTTTTKGVIAGMLGVAGMAGVITTLRRGLLSSEQLAASRTHPEKIVVRAADTLGMEDLADQTRRRLGDLMHFGYGAIWGVALARFTQTRRVHIVAHGLGLGLGLWTFGFNALLPAIRAHPGPWTWKRREFVLTLSAHITYGLVTAATLRLFQHEGNQP